MLWVVIGILAGLLFKEFALLLLDWYLSRKVASELKRRKNRRT